MNRDQHGRDIDVTEDELFARSFLAGIREQDPELAARLEPGPDADRNPPQRSDEDASIALAEQIRKEQGP